MQYRIERRQHYAVNTDGRCYNGAHFKLEIRQGPWEAFESDWTNEQALRRLDFWVDLNDYAVKERGKSAKTEYRIMPMTDAEVSAFRGVDDVKRRNMCTI
jgi:hypothetical protein